MHIMQVNFYFLVHGDRGTDPFAAAGLSVNTLHPPQLYFSTNRHEQLETGSRSWKGSISSVRWVYKVIKMCFSSCEFDRGDRWTRSGEIRFFWRGDRQLHTALYTQSVSHSSVGQTDRQTPAAEPFTQHMCTVLGSNFAKITVHRECISVSTWMRGFCLWFQLRVQKSWVKASSLIWNFTLICCSVRIHAVRVINPTPIHPFPLTSNNSNVIKL